MEGEIGTESRSVGITSWNVLPLVTAWEAKPKLLMLGMLRSAQTPRQSRGILWDEAKR